MLRTHPELASDLVKLAQKYGLNQESLIAAVNQRESRQADGLWVDLHHSLDLRETAKNILSIVDQLSPQHLCAVVVLLPTHIFVQYLYRHPDGMIVIGDEQLSVLQISANPTPDDLKSFSELAQNEPLQIDIALPFATEQCIPLETETGIFAYISLEATQPTAPERLPQGFLAHASVALQNAVAVHLLRESSAHVAELYHALSLLLKDIPTGAGITHIAKYIVSTVQKQFALVDCKLLLLNTDSGLIEQAAQAGRNGITSPGPIHLTAANPIADSVRSASTVYLPVVHHVRKDIPKARAVQSDLVVPLVANQTVVGALNLQSAEQDAFTAEIIRVIEVFAARATVIIENARLNLKLTAQNAQLEQRVVQRTRQLEHLTERVTTILNSNYDAIALANEHGAIRQTNIMFDRLFDYHGDDAFNLPITTLVADEQKAPIEAFVHDHDQAQLRTEVTMLTRHGHTVPIDLTITRIQGESIRGMVVGFHDLSERIAAEAKIRRSEAELRAIFESSTIGFAVLNPERKLHSINSVGREMTGRILGQPLVIGDDARDIFPQEEFPDMADYVQRSLHGEIIHIENLFMTHSHEPLWLDLRCNPITADDGEVIGVCLTMQDISEIKQSQFVLEESLQRERELNELRTRFVTMVSHELRTPLATIQATSNKLEYYITRMNDEQRALSFTKIDRQIQHLLSLLDDVLFVGKAQATPFSFEYINVDLKQFCEGIVEDLRAAFSSEIPVQISSDGSCSVVQVAIEPLRQILTNLISNAFKYSPPDMPIEVGLACNADDIQIRVQDYGIGIPEQDQASLFTTFHRAGNVGNIPGTGLGLSVVKHAVDLQNGNVTFESELNKGTTFIITLPRVTKDT